MIGDGDVGLTTTICQFIGSCQLCVTMDLDQENHQLLR